MSDETLRTVVIAGTMIVVNNLIMAYLHNCKIFN